MDGTCTPMNDVNVFKTICNSSATISEIESQVNMLVRCLISDAPKPTPAGGHIDTPERDTPPPIKDIVRSQDERLRRIACRLNEVLSEVT